MLQRQMRAPASAKKATQQAEQTGLRPRTAWSHTRPDPPDDRAHRRRKPINARIDYGRGCRVLPVVSEELDLHRLRDGWTQDRQVTHRLRGHPNADQVGKVGSHALFAEG